MAGLVSQQVPLALSSPTSTPQDIDMVTGSGVRLFCTLPLRLYPSLSILHWFASEALFPKHQCEPLRGLRDEEHLPLVATPGGDGRCETNTRLNKVSRMSG